MWHLAGKIKYQDFGKTHPFSLGLTGVISQRIYESFLRQLSSKIAESRGFLRRNRLSLEMGCGFAQ
jgi:hypothetical protein